MKKELNEETMIEDPGIYIVQHKTHSKSSCRVCKLSDLSDISLPRRAALETRKDEVCRAIHNAVESRELITTSDWVDIVFNEISRVDEKTADEENGLLIMRGDW